MRLWSLHPRYLAARGSVALWREGLLAQKVVRCDTVGYRPHPQLDRFRRHSDPVRVVSNYLHAICDEGDRRGYQFDRAGSVRGNPRLRRRML